MSSQTVCGHCLKKTEDDQCHDAACVFCTNLQEDVAERSVTVKRTRRQWRKNRPQLKEGDTRIQGEVKVFYQDRLFGFIQPANGSPRIHFHYNNVHRERQKCVGVGRTVYFSVSRMKNGGLTALIA
jgi:cold shock CspA family protein